MITRPHRCVRVDADTTYCCWCGYLAESPDAFAQHVESEREKLRQPYCVTTIPSADLPPPCGVEIHSTPRADAVDAVAVVVVLPERAPGGRILHGRFHRHEILIAKSALDFLIDALDRHKQPPPEETPQ